MTGGPGPSTTKAGAVAIDAGEDYSFRMGGVAAEEEAALAGMASWSGTPSDGT